jgi:hypothetical protein
MSRIRADRIVNRAANGPVEAAEGITIPSNKSIVVGTNSGSVGQYLGVTPTGLAWSTPAGGSGGSYSYTDLTNKPLLFSGSYTDLTNKPLLFSGSYTDLTNKPLLFSGSYTDLTNKPTIPGAYTLPTATDTVLGGIKIGTGLSIDGSGIVSASAVSNSVNDYISEWTLTALNNDHYRFSGPGFIGPENDPVLYLVRGQKYKFTNLMGMHPFQIQSTPGISGTAYEEGILNNGVINGTLTWDVQFDSPNILYYQCTAHANMGGSIRILDEDGFTGPIDSLSDVVITSPSNGQVLTYSGTTWSNSPSTIQNVYSSVSTFPAANLNKGAFAYDDSVGIMYYSNAVSWTSQRIVTTNSSTSSDFATLLGNNQLTYSTSVVDVTSGDTAFNLARKILRLSNNLGTNSDVTVVAGAGLSIARTDNNLTITNDLAFTYGISAETATGANTTLRLGRTDSTNDDILLVGADGLLIERTDASTITFRAPPTVVTQYTDALAKDAVFLALDNGTKVGISYTYDSVNKVINSLVSGGDGGGEVLTYDLQGRSTTSNNAFVDLIPSIGTTDSIEFTSSGGSSVAWDNANKRITISSVAPVSADWNASSGLAQILNKPTIPSAYTLQIATADAIGGIRVGANLSINATTGVLDANTGSYTLPTATGSVLGGIKIGSGLSIDGNGVVTASGSSSVPIIQELSGTTASLAADATAELNIVGYKAYSLFKIVSTAESWIRIYTDDVSRDADATRSEGQDPISGSGVIAEIRTDGVTNTVLISPGILGFNNDSPRTTTIYLSVTNRSVTPTAITVTLTALKIGE